MQKVYFLNFIASEGEQWYAGWSAAFNMPFLSDVRSEAEPLHSQREVADVIACVGSWADALGYTIEVVEV